MTQYWALWFSNAYVCEIECQQGHRGAIDVVAERLSVLQKSMGKLPLSCVLCKHCYWVRGINTVQNIKSIYTILVYMWKRRILLYKKEEIIMSQYAHWLLVISKSSANGLQIRSTEKRLWKCSSWDLTSQDKSVPSAILRAAYDICSSTF